MAPRTAQKNRTRAALLAAARDVMAQGGELTVARVADTAQISRATAYRYFSDPGALAADAALDINVTSTEELLDGLEDPRARVHRIARYYLVLARDHEEQFRQFLAQTMRAWAKNPTAELRGARRVAAFAEALAPVRDRMEDGAFTDLVNRLSLLTGLEPHIAMADILRVDPDTGDRLQAGIVDALLDRYLPAD